MQIIFITGTDTDCGKTYATCQLLKHFQKQGKKAYALKPVASGCLVINNELISADVEQLKVYNSALNLPINHWKFEAPVSPHLAAKASNHLISAEELWAFCNKQPIHDLDYLLIEGAGGLMVPLNDTETWIDFLKLAKIPVILIVGMRLGCINHALLTDQVLASLSNQSLGWIANCIDPDMLMLEDNIDTLINRMKMPYLGRIEYDGTDLVTIAGLI